jgi:NAD(P)H-hydrate repair Nnr-like enzyme with NAD(P)H-hydrate dehydratase domain
MRSGAGYVKLLSEQSHPAAPADLVIDESPLSDALSDERISVILAGPGLGRGASAQARLAAALKARKPMILDADALTLLDPGYLAREDGSRVGITPHEGELSKLCDAFGIDHSSKIDRASALFEKTGMAVLAKGPDSILVSSQGIRFFERGSSWLSAAGTGDVLAGIAASRLAAHGDIGLALEEAVWLHQEAARIAGPAFTSGELAKTVSQAMASFL